MNFTVREAIKSDYDGICGLTAELDLLHHEALPQVFSGPAEPVRSREWLDEILEDTDAALFIAESGGNIVGLVHIAVRESQDVPILVKRKYTYIADIVVTEKIRGKGIGRSLMERVEQWALRRGVTRLELNVWDFNENALAFYNALGYTPSRHAMWKTLEDSKNGENQNLA